MTPVTQSKAKDLTLEKVTQAFRVISKPPHTSWRYNMSGDFSNAELNKCNAEEKIRFLRCLARIPITIHNNYRVGGDKKSDPATLETILKMLSDPAREKIAKNNRSIIYSTADGYRPISDTAFAKWNGFQVIDMDIDSEKIASDLKPIIFNALQKCNWFLGVALSSSHKGLHIYTKIMVPDEDNPIKQKMLFLTNFRHKYSFVYLACIKAAEQIGFTKDDLLSWMDLAMFKPQQGALIGYDPDALINTGFFEDFIYIGFDNVEDIGCPEIDWVTYPDLKSVFARWEWFDSSDDKLFLQKENVENLGDCGPDGAEHERIHYKHNDRWRIANTLVNIFGKRAENNEIDPTLAIKYMRQVVSLKVPDKEIIADCRTAARHNKPIDEWAVNRLNRMHGFNIKLNVPDEQVDPDEIMDAMAKASGGHNPNIIGGSARKTTFNITKNQYLSDILPDLEEALGQITLIEAGPGLGKTEMVKRIVAQGKKVMMILPFTSIIKSKVEHEEGWYYSYGSRKPRLDVEHGLALTVDKFARLNMADIKTAGFDYIFLDESHLLFVSEYRPIMSKVIDMIRNTDVPIILMTGTPTGELAFFPDVVHLHVIKEETRKKELRVSLVDSTSTLLYHMCRAMANSIASGRRVLFPTNEGTIYSKRIAAGVQYFLEQQHSIYEPLNFKYYKKSNNGDEFMDGVNFEKTIKDVDLVMCTTYMGCGVDIEDRYKFDIYFGDLCTAAECDQWCNRLRNNDLIVRMFVAKNDADGNSRHITRWKPMKFTLDDEEIRDVMAILKICNKMVERNPTEYKYNTVVNSILRENRYITYDEIKGKYYIDQIAYKTVTFEHKFRDYAQQLPVFMAGMQCYGYNISAEDLGEFNVQGAEVFKDLKNMIKNASDEQLSLNTGYVEELLDLVTDTSLETFKNIMKGAYEIKKGQDWKIDENNMVVTVKSVEVFEKVVPIFLSLQKRYEIKDVKSIFEYCRTNKRGYNFAAIQRIRTLVNIIDADENFRLDVPIKNFMVETWNWVDTIDELHKVPKTELDNFLIEQANKYAREDSDEFVPILAAVGACKKLQQTFKKIFKCLVRCSRPDKAGYITMERQELLWPKRGEENPNDNICLLNGFIDTIIKQDTATWLSRNPGKDPNTTPMSENRQPVVDIYGTPLTDDEAIQPKPIEIPALEETIDTEPPF